FKKPCNWLYFNNFKELFIHFYGTVVSDAEKYLYYNPINLFCIRCLGVEKCKSKSFGKCYNDRWCSC
ncbi:hypothetical protein, partial [Odoribacter splanchnicus]|uniref:hypothetical protein n=1 Tax=Odoribacter splanchnicus TaxID=28118 RepID=UPI0027BA07DB